MESKKILVGVPMHKSEVSSQVINSMIMGSSDVHQVDIFPLGLSLLAKNFNLIWIKAYTLGYDFVIIHHSDLGVVGNLTGYQGTWSDLLVQRMLENEAAVMSAVIPIKSPAGLTSTGIELVRDDPYSLRRLTMHELQRLPLEYINRADLCEAFGIQDEDQAGAMLINTGCLIMNLKDFPWATYEWTDSNGRQLRGWPGFQIEDTIAWNTQGRPESYTVPEDWAMSRWLHYHGGDQFPYYATRELVIAHLGNKAFLNNEVWGKDKDDPPSQHPIEEYRKG